VKIQIRRAYDPPRRGEGHRVLVDRVWPRGLRKEALELDAWSAEVAPSASLRKWFGHDPGRWQEFQERYFAELDAKPDALGELARRARRGRLTLVYGARDPDHNNAVALAAYLRARAAGRRPRARPRRRDAGRAPGAARSREREGAPCRSRSKRASG
jgi:uncharacterized protein YeaO (DUF488 family)